MLRIRITCARATPDPMNSKMCCNVAHLMTDK